MPRFYASAAVWVTLTLLATCLSPDIYTQAPNPEAGHEEEVIPPPGTPGGDPSVEPRQLLASSVES
jgi:hypothetical protein